MDKIKPLQSGSRDVKRTPLSGRPWRRTRDYALGIRRKDASARDVSLCEHCESLGRPYTLIPVECHHRTPRRTRPDLTHSVGNLQFLCKEHHSLRTMLENVEPSGLVLYTRDYPDWTACYKAAIKLGAKVVEL